MDNPQIETSSLPTHNTPGTTAAPSAPPIHPIQRDARMSRSITTLEQTEPTHAATCVAKPMETLGAPDNQGLASPMTDNKPRRKQIIFEHVLHLPFGGDGAEKMTEGEAMEEEPPPNRPLTRQSLFDTLVRGAYGMSQAMSEASPPIASEAAPAEPPEAPPEAPPAEPQDAPEQRALVVRENTEMVACPKEETKPPAPPEAPIPLPEPEGETLLVPDDEMFSVSVVEAMMASIKAKKTRLGKRSGENILTGVLPPTPLTGRGGVSLSSQEDADHTPSEEENTLDLSLLDQLGWRQELAGQTEIPWLASGPSAQGDPQAKPMTQPRTAVVDVLEEYPAPEEGTLPEMAPPPEMAGAVVPHVPAAAQGPAVAQVPVAAQGPAVAQVPAAAQGPAVAQVPAAPQGPVVAQVPVAPQEPAVAQVPVARQGSTVAQESASGALTTGENTHAQAAKQTGSVASSTLSQSDALVSVSISECKLTVSPPETGISVPVQTLSTGIAYALGDAVGLVVSTGKKVSTTLTSGARGVRAHRGSLSPQPSGTSHAAPGLSARMGGRVVHGVKGVLSGSGMVLYGGKELVVGAVGCVAGTAGSLGHALFPDQKRLHP